MAGLDEDAIDKILYLARANEVVELDSYLAALSMQSKRSKAELLTMAVDPYSKNTALHYAAANGHDEVIRSLFSTTPEKPASTLINAINDAGNSPLHWAAVNGQLESVKLLIQSGADVTIINKAGHDAVFEAEINDKKEVVDWLLGAVEELGSGTGQTDGAPSGETADEDMDHADRDNTLENITLAQGSKAAAPSVEEVRKQMEGIKTRDDNLQDG